MTPAAAPLVLGGLAGLALGSFAVTTGVRWSRGGNALVGRSQCDACGKGLGFAETAPLVAYVRLRGACAGCGARIDPVHLAGEAAGAAVGLTATALVLSSLSLPRALLVAALGLVLIAAAAVDLKARRLPDPMTAAAAVIALLLAGLAGWSAFTVGLAAAAVSTVVLLAVRAVSRRVRGDAGLGLGDVKLLAALALWLGLATPWALALAAGFGLATAAVLRPADGRVPFGPALAAGGWIVGVAMEAGLWPTMRM